MIDVETQQHLHMISDFSGNHDADDIYDQMPQKIQAVMFF